MDKPSSTLDGFRPLTWADLCADPILQDLPYKIELNALNQIVMAPANAYHSRYQSKIFALLSRFLKKGETIVELAVETRDNVKVPDVIWASPTTFKAHRKDLVWTSAPDICVEVLSPNNLRKEINAKRGLYFEKGAREVWVCDLKGKMTFFAPTGRLAQSVLCPKFPLQIKI